MTRNTGRRCELDTSVDEAISYYSALQILRQRIAELTEEEFCTWVVLGYLHAFELVNDGGDEAELATKLLTVSQPFAGADHRSKPLDLLLPYTFSRDEMESFDPDSMAGDWNPGGRFLTYGQAVQFLATYVDEEYAQKLIDRELRSGALRPIHPVLGVHTPGAEIQSLNLDFEGSNLGDGDVLSRLMFPSAWINRLCAEEFKGIEPGRRAELSGLVRSVESPPRTDLSPGKPFRDMTDLRWEEVTIEFVDADVVKISAKGIEERYTYAELGFKNRKSRDASPDAMWRILRQVFAPMCGEVSWKTPMKEGERDSLKMQVSAIRKRLKVFFGIDDDPFYPYKDKKSYKARFTLLPDPDALDDYRARTRDGGKGD